MIRQMLISYGLGAGFLWWILADMSTTTAIVSGVLLLAATAGLFVWMWLRSRRLRSEWEGYLPRLITHGGGGAGHSRWDRRKHQNPEDFESHVGGGW